MVRKENEFNVPLIIFELTLRRYGRIKIHFNLTEFYTEKCFWEGGDRGGRQNNFYFDISFTFTCLFIFILKNVQFHHSLTYTSISLSLSTTFTQKVPLSDEEIQKKREEAERKARRGEIDPMHEYAFQVICQVRDILKILNYWFQTMHEYVFQVIC